MSPAATPRQYTPEDLLRMRDGHRFELVDGELRERPMGTESSWTGGQLYRLLEAFCRANRLGWVFPADSGYQCFPGHPQKVRYPDVSFIPFGQLPGEALPQGHCPIAPALAVEVISPRDRALDLEEKIEEYLRAGVRLVWVINPRTRTARVHRPDGTITRLTMDQHLDGENVLPSFHCRLGDILPPPASNNSAQQR
jgi:Uma2 family endonuclease